MPYTTIQRVQRRAGVELTSAQIEEAALLIPTAEAFIDQRTGIVWPTAPGIVSESQRIYSHEIRLKRPPVESVQSVFWRTSAPNSEPVLLASSEWELFDPRMGILLVPRFLTREMLRPDWLGMGTVIMVNYTRAVDADGVSVDPRVTLAATDLVLWWLQPQAGGSAPSATVEGGGAGLPSGQIKSYSVGGDLQVTFTDEGRWGKGTTFGVPDNIVSLLDSMKKGRSSFA
jgi:hypothetical protein